MTDELSIQKLLKVMIDQDASDLYLMAGAHLRVIASMQLIRRLGDQKLAPGTVEQLANALMNEQQQREFSNEMEMNLSTAYPGMGRFRVNIYRQRGTVGMVIRQITTEIASIDDLGLPEIFKDIAMGTRGLVLMVGATGSGKSTSLAAMVDWRNKQSGGDILLPLKILLNSCTGIKNVL